MELINGFEDYELKFDGTITRLSDGFQPNVYVHKSKGYNCVGLVKNNGKWSQPQIHRLLALHFIANPLNKRCVDHIDGNKLNNNLQNLRWATHLQNQYNQVRAKGYCWDKLTSKWKAQIRINGKLVHLGRFDTEEEASDAYQTAKTKRDEDAWSDET